MRHVPRKWRHVMPITYAMQRTGIPSFRRYWLAKVRHDARRFCVNIRRQFAARIIPIRAP